MRADLKRFKEEIALIEQAVVPEGIDEEEIDGNVLKEQVGVMMNKVRGGPGRLYLVFSREA